MKIVIILLVLLNGVSCFSQENIYILIKKTSDVKHMAYKSDTIQHDQYYITLSPKINKISFSKEDGRLKKTPETRAYNRTSFDFIYQNINGNNNPILIDKNSMLNVINYNEMILAKDYKNLLTVIKSFENIYLIDETSFFEGYYIARKIEDPSFLHGL